MRKSIGKDHDHPDGRLMGRTVDMGDDAWNGGEYTVTGLQSGTATLTRDDGFQRHKDIHELRDDPS